MSPKGMRPPGYRAAMFYFAACDWGRVYLGTGAFCTSSRDVQNAPVPNYTVINLYLSPIETYGHFCFMAVSMVARYGVPC